MKHKRAFLVLICCGVFLYAACISSTTTSNIDEIQERLNTNKCRINREELIFQIQELEYLQDTTFSEIPELHLDGSLLVCPVTSQTYRLTVDGDERSIVCNTEHGDSSF